MASGVLKGDDSSRGGEKLYQPLGLPPREVDQPLTFIQRTLEARSSNVPEILERFQNSQKPSFLVMRWWIFDITGSS
jgi:hypothetical protein